MKMYTVDYSADEPIMLLNKQIGQSFNEEGEWDGVPYIDGADFQEELMQLDSMGKKRIQVWINSPGGNIMQAMNIFSAILKSNTPVDTYNVGVCASSAGLVFMAGRKRVMCDFAQFMMHPVSIEGGSDEENKSRDAFTESCKSMLSGKSDISAELAGYMMSVTTYLGASDCLMQGICTEIEATKDSNKKRMPVTDVKAMLAFSNNILDETILNIKPIITMDFSKITNKLKLVNGANEDTILSAINQMEEATEAATTAATEAQAKVDELTAQLAKANEELEAAKVATEAAEAVAVETAATEMVNSFKSRIGNDVDVVAKWVNKAKVDFEGTKELLESIPLNKTNQRVTTSATNAENATATTAAGIMYEISKRTNQSANY